MNLTISKKPLAWMSTTLLILAWNQAAAAETRVDLNIDQGRKDILTPGWENWAWKGGRSGTARFGEVSVTLRALGGLSLEGVWYKGLLDYGATMAADGISTRNESDPADGTIELVIEGLTAGRHSLVTYHNEVRKTEPTAFAVLVGATRRIENVVPTRRATNDSEVTSAYVEFEAVEGEEVVVRFVPDPLGNGQGIVLNGFELDTADPSLKATQPFPRHGDRHVPTNSRLHWAGAASAVTHHLYFGLESNRVASATSDSPEHRGALASPSFRPADLAANTVYFWRVDEVDTQGVVTRGDPWQFRVRHPAFPTAEGYGRFARGGRGGRVIHVRNLNDSGPGSLRAAVETDGPRTVVFDVSGLITLESPLVIRNSHLTIAGQTAPGKGICIRKFNMGMMGAEDVIVRYLRVRPGNISGRTLDGMGMASSDHCIIDHCSISWTLDEAVSSRGAKNITLQRTLIAEALNDAGHKNYPPGTQHGYAASIGGGVGSFHHNLLAHCSGRNWSLAGGLNNRARHTGWLDIRNNVVYNWKNRTTDGGAEKVNFVNNYYKPGPASRLFTELNPQFENPGFGPQMYYVEGNVMEGRHGPEGPLGPFQGVRAWPDTAWEEFTVPTPFFDSHVKTHSAEECYENVLGDVGCNFPVLDEHDQRVMAEVRAGTFKYRGSRTDLPGLPDSQDDVGGWEDYPEESRPVDWDTDQDGMPSEWEARRGLDANDPSDGNGDRDGDGYTNLEEYLGSLVGEFQ